MKVNTQRKIFDCDIHQTFRHQSELFPYLHRRFVKRIEKNGLGYPPSPYTSPLDYKRKDSLPPSGPAGSDRSFLKKQLLEEMGIERGILNGSGIIAASYIPEIEYPAHLVRAYNLWLIEEWLEKEDVFYGSLHIALQNVEESVAMIKELGKHEKIVQVIVPAMTPLPIAHAYYKPILKAIQEMDLTLAFHLWQPSILTHSSTPIGNPALYLEWKTQSGLPLISQMLNMILNGVFVEFPDLRCVLLEGGYSWLIYFKHRMDQLYKSFRQEAAWLTEKPSYYLMRNCRFSTQPLEEFDAKYSKSLFEAFDADDLLMFASDYPHWDGDSPNQIDKLLNTGNTDKILYQNAMSFYKIKN